MRNKIAMFGIHSDPLALLGSQEAGGQNVYIYSLVKELDKIGWSVDVFTRCDQLRKKPIAFIGKKSRVIRLMGGPAKHVPKTDLFDYFQELYQNFLHFINYQNPYSIFHGHHWDARKKRFSWKRQGIVGSPVMGRAFWLGNDRGNGLRNTSYCFQQRKRVRNNQTRKNRIYL